MTKWVYSFGPGNAEGKADMAELLGGKGANLAEMCRLGLPVPPGLTITTAACAYYTSQGQLLPDGLADEVLAALGAIEREIGAKFGHAKNPLLVSVRSGAAVSMPGMMDTVLNLGLNDETVEGLVQRSGEARFAYDSYRRFIQMYGDVVMGIDRSLFEEHLECLKDRRGLSADTDLTADDWQQIISNYKSTVESELGVPFPQDPHEQLWGAVGAVFNSCMSKRAQTYRRLHGLSDESGTAVNVQAMVFGNTGEDSATGVAFTRNPSTGQNEFYGEYLINAQGEDVVAGIRTPQHLTTAAKKTNNAHEAAMEEVMPAIFAELEDVRSKLETHYRDMQDVEFTVQQGKLYILQTRSGKRTAAAAVKIAVDMAQEGLINESEAIMRVEADSLDQLLHPSLDPRVEKTLLASGLPASPGAASGRIVFSAEDAVDQSQKGLKVILVRIETSPEDIQGMHAAQGILTTRGGMTSHAAVVARGMGRPCVVGAGSLSIDYKAGTLKVGDHLLQAGDLLTIDGASGEIIVGEVPTVEPDLSDEFRKLMVWTDGIRRLKVRTNAETVPDCRTAREFGAEGIGLCRTEHMFFAPERILAIRKMIFADDGEGRSAAINELLPFQRGDFIEIFQVMEGLPVTIRLLDPPLHEFLPHTERELEELAKAAGEDIERVRHRAQMLQEANPMLGHRGCRLGISYPEIYRMQARAIFEAAIDAGLKNATNAQIEIMVPLVATQRELVIIKAQIEDVAEQVTRDKGMLPPYLVGTMIELPRAALCAAGLAREAEFFSFGTNDLTQTAFGISRDDAGNFLPDYEDAGIFSTDPFVTLDQEGVGELVRMAAERGRAARADLKLGICGEHGGDPTTITFFESVGLDYVSCSPYRVPVARLAAAQATLAKQKA